MSEIMTQNNKKLQEQLERTQRELSVLYDVSNAMRTTLELDHILYIILTSVTAHHGLGFNRALLFLVNAKERILEGKMAISPESGEDARTIWNNIAAQDPDLDDLIAQYRHSQTILQKSSLYNEITNLKIPLHMNDGGLLARAYFDGSPLHIDSANIAEHQGDPLLTVFKTNELVIMPLKAKDKVKGLIIADNLYTQKPIAEDSFRLFTMLANQAGLAIENSQLYEMFVQKSRTDSLTNLWNHGFFQDALEIEIEKTRDSNMQLSLMMIDLDDFKKFNDTCGHRNGDIVLSKTAALLKESSRESDYVCRYGGEEFSVILPNTNEEQAYVIAERLRECIAHWDFPRFSAAYKQNITASIGIAVFPDDAPTKEELIQRADRAMYTAKFIGKNKTCLASNKP